MRLSACATLLALLVAEARNPCRLIRDFISSLMAHTIRPRDGTYLLRHQRLDFRPAAKYYMRFVIIRRLQL